MSSDCKLVRDLCEQVSKLITVVKEHRAEVKKQAEPKKPEEIEMKVIYREPVVRFTEPEEKWSEIRRRRIEMENTWVPSKPIKIIYPKRVQDW